MHPFLPGVVDHPGARLECFVARGGKKALPGRIRRGSGRFLCFPAIFGAKTPGFDVFE
jgi:hypothetical protein